MFVILEAMSEFGIDLQNELLEVHFFTKQKIKANGLQEDTRIIRQIMENRLDGDAFSADVKKALLRLWKDGGVQKCYALRNKFPLPDCAQ